APLAALMALAINFTCEPGLSESAGLALCPFHHHYQHLPHQILCRPSNNIISSPFPPVLIITLLSVLVQKPKKRLAFVLAIFKVLLQQRRPVVL
ncbi:hypothetical protein FRC02_007536, partial [Tulasnella sp. 418]